MQNYQFVNRQAIRRISLGEKAAVRWCEAVASFGLVGAAMEVNRIAYYRAVRRLAKLQINLVEVHMMMKRPKAGFVIAASLASQRRELAIITSTTVSRPGPEADFC